MPPGGQRTLADRLDRLRRVRLVGRTVEMDVFREMLERRSLAAILHVHGPGGIGKSVLLAAFARLAEDAGRPVLQIDARNVPPTLDGFREAVALDDAPSDLVLLIDSLDHQEALGHWLMRDFLPSLPADALVVLAGRTAPADEWRTDPGYAELMRTHRLGGIGDDDASALLSARGIAGPEIAAAIVAARGHPLALALAAEALAAGRADLVASPDERRHLFAGLVGRFADDAPSPLHEDALRLLVLARNTSPAMLADIFGGRDGPALSAWLAALPFVERGLHGLSPHDLVREVLEGDWLHRDPERLEQLRRGAMRHIHRLLVRLGPEDRHRLSQDWTFLVRDTPLWRFLDWSRFGSFYADGLAAGDGALVADMIRTALGPESAAIAERWMAEQPENWRLLRDRGGTMRGAWCELDLGLLDPARLPSDPVTRAALAAVAHHPPDGPGVASLSRFCVHDGSVQLPNATFDRASLENSVRWMTDLDLHWTLVAFPEPERLAPMFASLSRFHWHDRVASCDRIVDGRTVGIYARNWRREPNPLWAGIEPARRPKAILDRAAFADAVREALRTYARPERLAANPLCGCAVAETVAGVTRSDRIRRLLDEAAEVLLAHPRDHKFHRAVRLTFLDPGSSQEAVAAELGLPFNTYRYHLARGLDRIAEILWERECGAEEPRVTATERPE